MEKLLPQAELCSKKETIDSIFLINRFKNIGIITFLVPLIGTICAFMLWFINGSLDYFYLIQTIVMYIIATFGLEVGYHRYLSHNSFKTGKTVRTILTVLGAMAASGPPIYWAATHRLHHKYSDHENDPHSPHLFGNSILDKLKGAWHAQVGWMLQGKVTNTLVMARNLHLDSYMRKIESLYPFWVFLGLFICFLLGVFHSNTFYGGILGVLWGGFVRIFFVHLLYIGGLNSICHTFGTRRFNTNDLSRNTWWMVLPTLGESWHNNHHAYPSSAYLSVKWWEFDPSGYLIYLLYKLGLVWDVNSPKKNKNEIN